MLLLLLPPPRGTRRRAEVVVVLAVGIGFTFQGVASAAVEQIVRIRTGETNEAAI